MGYCYDNSVSLKLTPKISIQNGITVKRKLYLELIRETIGSTRHSIKELTTFDYEHPITTGASFNNDSSKEILTHSHTESNFFIWDINNKNLLATLNYQEKIGDESQ